MKKFKFALFAFMVSMMAFTFASCSDDDEVKDVSVTGVTIAPQTLDLKEGTTGTLTASVAPTNATKKTVSWTSSDEKVATVDNGTVTAVAEGTATITVRTDEGGFTATATVNVTKDIPPFDESKYHFDLFLTVDKHGGMSSKNITIANSTASLKADRGTITVVREGAELGYYTMESISKGKYYYQVYSTKGSGAGDRFVKYQIKNNKVIEVQSQRFSSNGITYNVRNYTHAWLDDNTLLIMGSTGDNKKLIWTKLNANDMTILDEGELSDITIPEGWTTFTSSGILSYREADNKLFYFYFVKKDRDPNNPRKSTNEPKFRVAVINPDDMKVEKWSFSPVESEMAGSAYGELMQNTVMYDEVGNLYIAAFHKDDIEKGMLLRIKAGETEIDPDYNGYKDSDGKLLTVQYLGNNKAFIYARNDKAPVVEIGGKKIKPTDIDGYSHYYAILDLATGEKSRMSFGGKELAYSGGRFSQRSVIFNNKVYFGTNTKEDKNSIMYIYDIESGNVEKGAEVDGGFFFDMIRVIEND